MENKPASLLVVSLGKALNGMPPSLCGRQMVGPSSLPVVVAQSARHLTGCLRLYVADRWWGPSSLPVEVAQSDERHANRASAHTHE